MSPPGGVEDGFAPSLAVLADGAEGTILSLVRNPALGDESAPSVVDGRAMSVKCEEGEPQPSWFDVPVVRRSPHVIVLCVATALETLFVRS